MPPPHLILCLQASSNYTIIHLVGNKKLCLAKCLKEFEYLNEAAGFYRVHRGWVVNKDYIVHANSKVIELQNQLLIPISVRKRAKLTFNLNSLHKIPEK
jgi:DNA-binding LytR/AlgR family response regulator